MPPGERLRVGIDARALAEQPCGFRRHLEALLPTLHWADPGLEPSLFTALAVPAWASLVSAGRRA